jgi:hypothetical protein
MSRSISMLRLAPRAGYNIGHAKEPAPVVSLDRDHVIA